MDNLPYRVSHCADSRCPQWPRQIQGGCNIPPPWYPFSPIPLAIPPINATYQLGVFHHPATVCQLGSEFKPRQNGVHTPQCQPMPVNCLPHPLMYPFSEMHAGAGTLPYPVSAISRQPRYGPPVPHLLPPCLPQVPTYPCYIAHVSQSLSPPAPKTVDLTLTSNLLPPTSALTAIQELERLDREFNSQNPPRSSNEDLNGYCSSANFGVSPHQLLQGDVGGSDTMMSLPTYTEMTTYPNFVPPRPETVSSDHQDYLTKDLDPFSGPTSTCAEVVIEQPAPPGLQEFTFQEYQNAYETESDESDTSSAEGVGSLGSEIEASAPAVIRLSSLTYTQITEEAIDSTFSAQLQPTSFAYPRPWMPTNLYDPYSHRDDMLPNEREHIRNLEAKLRRVNRSKRHMVHKIYKYMPWKWRHNRSKEF